MQNFHSLKYGLQSTDNMYKDMAFCHLLENLDINTAKQLMGTATKTGKGAAKTASKKVVQKTAEATGHWIGSKITDKITSAGKSKNEQKEKEKKVDTNDLEEIYIPPEKRQQIIDDLRLF